MGNPSPAARLWPWRVRLNNRRASASMARPRKNPASDGEAIAMTVTSNAMTAINSTSVNARHADCCDRDGLLCRFIKNSTKSFLSAGIRDVVFAADLAVRSAGGQIVGRGIRPARAFVDVVVVPRILRQFLEIRPAPVLRVARLLDQVRQAALAFRVIAVVHLKRIERGGEGRD